MDFNYKEHYQKDADQFDYFEERFGATEHDERRLREYVISETDSDISIIIDVGCGSAWVAKHFLKLGKKVISLDISKINPQKALDKYPSSNHFGIVADSYKLPFDDNSFDLIIASEIIEHVINPNDFVNELFRALRPGGKLILSTPYKEKLRYSLCIHCNQKTPINAHLHSFDENILTSLCNSDSLFRNEVKIFGNKYLIFLRTYIFLKYLPFKVWKVVDQFANTLFNKPIHIIVSYIKKPY